MALVTRSALVYTCACDFPGCSTATPELALKGPFGSRSTAVAELEHGGWRQIVRAGRQKAIEQIAMRGDGDWRCPRCVRAGRAKETPMPYGGT